jgi:hypothetical protein
VTAKVNVDTDEDERSFVKRMKRFCADKLENYQIPVKISLERDSFTNARMKKIRKT